MSDIKKMLDTQHEAFAELKNSVDALEKKHDVLDNEKLARVQKSLDEVTSKLEEFALKAGRPGASSAKAEVSVKKNAFLDYAKNGEKLLEVEVLKTLAATSSDAKDGSYTVPEDIEQAIIDKLYEMNPLRMLVGNSSTSSEAKEFLYETGEFEGGWIAEEGERVNTGTAQIGNIIVPVHELYANPKATRRILADSFTNLEAWIVQKAAEKLDRVERLALLSGDGTGKPKGLLTGANTTATQLVLGKIAAASATAITFDDLIKQYYALNQEYTANAVYMGNKIVFQSLRTLKDGNNNYIWQPSTQVGEPSTILGHKFYTNSDMDNSVNASSDLLVFGDLKQAYARVDRPGSMTMMRDEITDKRYVQFYTTYRVGGAVVNGFAANVLSTPAS